GSRPETTIDPVVMAAATVLRLQTIVSREVAGTETAVLSVGTLHAGSKENIIPDRAELGLSVRTYDAGVRDKILAGIERIVRAEAAASGATTPPDVKVVESFPPTINDDAGAERTRSALGDVAPVVDPGLVTGSEDVGLLATAAGAPLVYWILGGADPAAFEGANTREELLARVAEQPSNHSPFYAPVVEPTLSTGVAALVGVARRWLPPS
ncbi:MAG: peptidase dimerization domain-containing protein, partial [Pseudonocardia sp.]|nr:peptidase dimerization domain-containing protein [Pseudonocardia sp.]